MTSRLTLPLCALYLAACVEGETRSDSTIDRPRIVAVIADPPEASPGTPVRFQAVVATPTGPADPLLTWSFCSTVRSASDNTAAAPACILNAEQPLPGEGTGIDAVIPIDACMRFGSETASGRVPNAVDATGGYYQPLRVLLPPYDATLVRQRIRCALPNAPLTAARDYNRDYKPNQAPRIAAIRAFSRNGEASLSALPATADLTFQIEPDASARESYLRYDPRAGTLTTAVERLSTTWYVTTGAFEHATLDVTSGPTQNTWHSDDLQTAAWLWVVLRDDRGGLMVETRSLARSIRADGLQ